MEKITSLQNPKIKNVLKLRKTRERKNQNLIVVEGRHEIFMAQESGLEISQLFLCSNFFSDENFIIEKGNSELFDLDKIVYEKISVRENPDGYLALVTPRTRGLDELKLPDKPLLLILDKIEKPGNIGAILRSADGAGVDAVLVNDPQTDIFNHNVIRTSLGTVFTNQIAFCSTKNCQEWLEDKNITTVITTPRAQKKYTDIDYDSAMAVVIGTEHEGLGSEWLDFADEKVKISMKGKIDSLNASVSAALLIYEARRQRG